MSPAAAASAAVGARARGPSPATRSARVSGPRLLLSTTSWPASTASRATVLPMFPLPMSPIVVTSAGNAAAAPAFPSLRRSELADGELRALGIAEKRRARPRVLGRAQHGCPQALGRGHGGVAVGDREGHRPVRVLLRHQP